MKKGIIGKILKGIVVFFILACLFTIGAVVYAIRDWNERLRADEKAWLQTEAGKHAVEYRKKFMKEISTLSPGTVVLTTYGNVELLNRMAGTTVYFVQRYSQQAEMETDTFSGRILVYYPPGANGQDAKKRIYLLEMYSQGKQVPKNWEAEAVK